MEPEKPDAFAGYAVLILIVACIAAYWAVTSSSNRPSTAKYYPQPSTQPNGIERVAFSSSSPRIDGIHVLVDATLRNGNPYAVKDAVIECEQRGASGTVIRKAEKTVYEIIPAGEARTFKALEVGIADDQAKTVPCRLAAVARQ